MAKIKFVMDVIKDKPGVFFKKHLEQSYFQLTQTVTIPKWLWGEEMYRVEEIQEYTTKGNINKFNDVANILETLEKWYPDTDFDYKNETYVSASIKLYKLYIKTGRFEKYKDKKDPSGLLRLNLHHLPLEAYRELISRGFIPRSLVAPESLPAPKSYFIRGNNLGKDELIYPKEFKTQKEALDFRDKIGITGYAGVNTPK